MSKKPSLNFGNRTLFHGDNLDFLRGMNSETVDLIATDPPFNKGRDFHATPDSLSEGASFQDRWSWERDIHEGWVDQISDDFPDVWRAIENSRHSYGDDMGAFLCFMAVRLISMQRVLKPTGSIYLHCDPTASHYLKMLMDGIFGKANFRSEIVWKRTSAANTAKRWGPIHDIILFYTNSKKSKDYTWNVMYQPYDQEYVDKFYDQEDKRGAFYPMDLTGPGIRTGSSGTPWRSIDPSPRHWGLPPKESLPEWFVFPKNYDEMNCQERLDVLDKQGLVHWPERGNKPRFKLYLSVARGNRVQDIITDIKPISAKAKENTNYPTQKPIALYERIIRASSNEGDMVLDPFCGCATTLIAAEKLGRQWVGMDIWKGAHEIVIERLVDENLISPDGKKKKKNKKGMHLFSKGSIKHETEVPKRTDSTEADVPRMETKLSLQEDRPTMTKAEMKEYLLKQQGNKAKCQGCYHIMPDERHLELDHNRPKSDGGSNALENRTLLCGPCNRKKSDRLTLTGLRKQNKKEGLLAEDSS